MFIRYLNKNITISTFHINKYSVVGLGAHTRGGLRYMNLVPLQRQHSTESIFYKYGRLNADRDLHLAA
jgi:hypothetical protein